MNEQESILILNALLVGYEFVESLDKIQGLSFYQKGLKQKVDTLLPSLEKFADQLNVIFGVDDKAMFDILDKKKELMKKIALLRPENKAGLNELLDLFFQSPELLIHRNGIKLIENGK